MNVRSAILRAALHIESRPDDFDFMSTQRPKSGTCGTPGCALGWIGFFLDIETPPEGSDTFLCRVNNALGVSSYEFYDRMDSIDRAFRGVPGTWTTNPFRCHVALRVYASQFHPLESPQ